MAPRADGKHVVSQGGTLYPSKLKADLTPAPVAPAALEPLQAPPEACQGAADAAAEAEPTPAGHLDLIRVPGGTGEKCHLAFSGTPLGCSRALRLTITTVGGGALEPAHASTGEPSVKFQEFCVIY